MYHRVASPEFDANDLAVSPENFSAQMRHLREQWQPVSLSEMVHPMTPRSREMVSITFDDGYADNYDAAVPILDSLGVPATFFVISSTIGSDREFWWDELEGLLDTTTAAGRPRQILVPGTDRSYDVTGDGGQRRVHQLVEAALTSLTPAAIDDALGDLARSLGLDRTTRNQYLPMSARQVSILAKSNLHEIGNHSRHHRRLGDLPFDAQLAEIADAQRDIEAITGRRPRFIAYPGGDASEDTRRAARDVGLVAGLGTEFGVVNRSELFNLRRCMVRNWDEEEFAKRLRRWA